MGKDLRIALVAAALGLVGLLAAGAGARERSGAGEMLAGEAAVARSGDAVERGAYLVRATGCSDCHTPLRLDPALGILVPDTSRAFSGHPSQASDPGGTLGAGDIAVIGPTFTSFKLPFGTVRSANLTPHSSGLGAWTEEQFVQAMRTGMHLGAPEGRPILPPMPWMNLAEMTDRDLRSMYSFFMSLPPIDNQVPAPDVKPEVFAQFTKAWARIRPRAPAP